MGQNQISFGSAKLITRRAARSAEDGFVLQQIGVPHRYFGG
jgi:hypothetical protein